MLRTVNLYPKKALILAAGYGTRMEPLTRDLPKPLMPFWNKPILQHSIEMLASWGVESVTVNVHHQAEQIIAWLLAYAQTPGAVRIQVSCEPEILGTGGALVKADWFLADDNPCWVFNGDVVAQLDPEPLVRAFARHRPLGALWMHAQCGPRTVRVEKQRVTDFHVDDPGGDDTATFCGLQILDGRVLNFLPREVGFASIIQAYRDGMKKGEQIAGIQVPGSWWHDLGTPKQYLHAHAEAWKMRKTLSFISREAEKSARALNKDSTCTDGFACVDPKAVIAPGARLCNSVVWSGARLGAHARLTDAVVGRQSSVNVPARGVVVPAALALQEREKDLLTRLKWNPDRTTVQTLPARGSDRSYVRVTSGPRRKAILVRYGTERGENEHSVQFGAFLAKQGIRVAKVLSDDPAARITILEDLGDIHLLDMVGDGHSLWVQRFYARVLDQLALMHGAAPAAIAARLPLQPAFSPKLYQWERNYFAKQFLEPVAGWTSRRSRYLLKELDGLDDWLADATPALIHRDLQSTNVLVNRHQPAFIDFQGMRIGAAAYDLASLLADPYAMLPVDQQLRLLAYYAQITGDHQAVEQFWPACIQRMSQALGAFGRLGQDTSTRRFLSYIGPALTMMNRALEHLHGFQGLRKAIPELREQFPS
jgi:NDP-sugar pyrophosphorylase family protein/aminoglycoside/choline kinase family phosphotransferase